MTSYCSWFGFNSEYILTHYMWEKYYLCSNGFYGLGFQISMNKSGFLYSSVKKRYASVCVCVCMYITNDDDHRIVLVHSALLYRIICYFLCTRALSFLLFISDIFKFSLPRLLFVVLVLRSARLR